MPVLSLVWGAPLQGRLVRRKSILDPPDTLYYNVDPMYTSGDVQKEEAVR
jgi:hypothetical protein